LVGQNNQHQRGWNDLRQRPRGGNNTRCQPTVVAIAQHNGQGDEPHRNNRSRNYARGGGQHGTYQHNGDGQAAPYRAEQLTDGFEQVFGHAGSLKNQAHQGKEGNGQQGVIGQNAKYALRQGLEQCRFKQAQLNAEQPKEN